MMSDLLALARTRDVLKLDGRPDPSDEDCGTEREKPEKYHVAPS